MLGHKGPCNRDIKKKKKKKVWRKIQKLKSSVSKALSRQNLTGHSGSLVLEMCAGLWCNEGYTLIVWTGIFIFIFLFFLPWMHVPGYGTSSCCVVLLITAPAARVE